MFSKFLIVTAIIGLVLALEGNFKFNKFSDKTNSILKTETYEPKSDNYKIENVCIDQLNEQIRLEMHASLNYMNMVRDDLLFFKNLFITCLKVHKLNRKFFQYRPLISTILMLHFMGLVNFLRKLL